MTQNGIMIAFEPELMNPAPRITASVM